MYCNRCRTYAAADAKFCSNCGNPVISENSIDAPSVEAVDGKPGIFGLYFAGILIAFGYAFMFFSAFTDGKSITPQLGGSATFWTAVWFYYVWKRRALDRWRGALIGTALGLLLFSAAAFVHGFMQGTTRG